MKYLSIDAGTTCCKCQLFNEDGSILFYESQEIPLWSENGEEYVNTEETVRVIKKLIRSAAKIGNPDSIALSTIGESFVLLDENDTVLFRPMLYTDIRGSEQAAWLSEHFEQEHWFTKTGTLPHAMYSISKYLWIRQNHPQIAAKAKKLMLMNDYLGYLLTGKRVIDYSLAARSGIFDIRRKCFAEDLLEELDIPVSLFSEPMPAGSVVGRLLPSVAEELGIGDCVLVLGSHDQICATLGTGVLTAGQSADGMGTVECITTVLKDPPTDKSMGEHGLCVVPYPGGLYASFIVNYSSGSLINWYRKKILHGYSGNKSDFFAYMDGEVADNVDELLVLPYFGGPAMFFGDQDTRGAILNLSLSSSDADIYRAILEATAYEMKMNLEFIESSGIRVESTVATGGGANSALWLRIKSDITGITVRTLRSSEGGLCGAAILQAISVGGLTPNEAVEKFVRYKDTFTPRKTHTAAYEKKFHLYKKLYSACKEFN